MVDASNRDRLQESRMELVKLLSEKELKDAALLILANKQVSLPLFVQQTSTLLMPVEIINFMVQLLFNQLILSNMMCLKDRCYPIFSQVVDVENSDFS